uniref:Major facilitator superfamily (MFS) profile domain-containing protein n=1 Tax=Pyrodinium bahamense TaxID=73915 RepID=A0A7S0B329_9DINO
MADQCTLLQMVASVEHAVPVAPEASDETNVLLQMIEDALDLKETVPRADVVSCIVLAGVFGIFVIASLPDFHRFLNLPRSGGKQLASVKGQQPAVEEQDNAAEESKKQAPDDDVAPSPPPASMATILGLTFYRFYTGFLSATWLPYLLAMEGAELWRDNQALFMGLAKLIYGLSILMTPLFGLLGDRLAFVSHSLGRRLFVRVGIIVAAMGIFLCHWSAQSAPRRPGHFSLFLLGILIWRLGEGLNDVTTEAICPEMLPSQQYEISSAIRASMFLVGGLGGYVLVMLLVHMPYYWLYHGYLIMMFTCGVPPLLAITRDIPNSNTRGASRLGQSFLASCVEAYLKPAQYEGGFPCACLCIFLFSCGSAPMFFLLLMLRDLVGIDEQVRLQRHFSLISIDFFLSAAVAAVLNALVSPKRPKGSSNSASELRESSFRYTAFATMSFGIVCVLMPFVSFFAQKANRAQAFYVLSALLGATFGSVYARFQDCTWQLLPPNVEFANAMGFSTMWKLLGAGLGNFIAGLVLDLFQKKQQLPPDADTLHATHLVAYQIGGYYAVCFGSAFLAFVTGALVLTIPGKAAKAKSAAIASN